MIPGSMVAFAWILVVKAVSWERAVLFLALSEFQEACLSIGIHGNGAGLGRLST